MRPVRMIMTAALFWPAHVSAQSKPHALVGERVALRPPPAAFRLDSSDGSGHREWIAEVTRSGNGILVNGKTQWAGLGLSPAASYLVAGADRNPATHRLDLRLEGKWSADWRVSIPLRDTAFVLPQLFAPVADTVAVAAETRESVRRRLFSGAMAGISAAGQAKILLVVASRSGYHAVNTVDLDGRPYLEFQVIESTYTCTIGESSDPERQAAAIAETAFPVLWNLGAADSTMTGEFGFAIRVHMKRNYSCSTEGSPDFVTIYAPADAARRYATGAATGGELLARSVTMFNGNRVAVALPK